MSLRPLLPPDRPWLALAPMQDVTDLTFWKAMHRYGGPDVYYTEYIRVHENSRPDRDVVRAVTENPTGRPAIVQMIGQDIPSLVRVARQLQRLPVCAIDLNLGCPAPIVCRKEAGGGLLRNLPKIDAILRALREAIEIPFTVKTRIGFDRPEECDALLDLFARHPIDLLTVHGRTVREMYRTEVHYDRIAQIVRRMPCPVLANGNVLSVRLAREIAAETGAAGLMIGRGAIRNPWLFEQIRAQWEGRPVFRPTLRDVRGYVEHLYEATAQPGFREADHVSKMKKYLNFIGQGIGEGEAFLKDARAAGSGRAFFAACDRHLSDDAPLPDEPPGRSLRCARSEQLAQLG
ncbi:MAG: tRNA-dihydrouridine synthase family protein [Verrucomicrobium sp.]|nr:tRNA-dihydrouridine synthase family protein [Verrucomicrobium sp.]